MDTRYRLLIAATVLAGALGLFANPSGNFLEHAQPVQSLISVVTPAFGIRLIRALPRRRALLIAALIGLVAALYGAAISAIAAAVNGDGVWWYAAQILLGSVLVQVCAAIIGVGLGALIRWPWIAFLASIVLPLGLWAVLGPLSWLTPYEQALLLLSHVPSPLMWAQWLVMVLIWPVGLNVAAAWLKLPRRSDRTAVA